MPVNSRGEIIRKPSAEDIVFDATLRYVIIVEVAERGAYKAHSLAAYWKFPLYQIGESVDVNSRMISDSTTIQRNYPKSAIAPDAQLNWLEKI